LEYQEKTKKASPHVKEVAYRGLQHQTKKEIRRLIKTARVVRHGDISFNRRWD